MTSGFYARKWSWIGARYACFPIGWWVHDRLGIAPVHRSRLWRLRRVHVLLLPVLMDCICKKKVHVMVSTRCVTKLSSDIDTHMAYCQANIST